MPALSPKPQSHPNPNLESNPYPKPPPPRLFEQAEIDRWNAMFAAEAAALQQAGPGGPGGGGRGGGGGGPPGARVRVSHCPGCGQATVGGGGARVSGRWALSVTTAPPVWTPTQRPPQTPPPPPVSGGPQQPHPLLGLLPALLCSVQAAAARPRGAALHRRQGLQAARVRPRCAASRAASCPPPAGRRRAGCEPPRCKQPTRCPRPVKAWRQASP
jgi:hypothetical protein